MKRILFVDDEDAALEGLRARLHRLHTKWEMAFVNGAARAIECMQALPYDVIVTDMRMPGMDGAGLLDVVTSRWPQTIRIVLSGYGDAKQNLRLVPLAHQFLSKPCQPKQLENVIDRCLLLHELLGQPGLRSVVGRIRRLPTVPRIYLALRDVVNDEKTTVADVARIVEADVALAARVLQIVNSAFFRLARRMSNIEQAVAYLGFESIRSIAMSIEVFSQWQGGRSSGIDLEKLQQHAHAVAGVAGALTAKMTMTDDALLAGLLHDIGYWVLLQECPGDLDRSVKLAVERAIPLYIAERQVIGASHAEIGAYLLGIWGLPHAVVEAVAHHHQPDRVSHVEFDVLGSLVIARSLTAPGEASVFPEGVGPDPKIDPSSLCSLHAPFDWAEAVRRVPPTSGEVSK
jgi:putative nucleotidyltransferase with HDIG domain